jgi:hypothetical protein
MPVTRLPLILCLVITVDAVGCGARSAVSQTDGAVHDTGPDVCAPLVEGAPCIIDLSMCLTSLPRDKDLPRSWYPPWRGKRSLNGTIIFAWYLDKSGLACKHQGQGWAQGWPVITEPPGRWHCGVVRPDC